MFRKMLMDPRSLFVASASAAAHLYLGKEFYVETKKKARLNFFDQAAGKGKRDIFFASNSHLYAFDRSLLSQGKKPPVVVTVPMWLDKALPEYDDNTWGQTKLGFPVVPRKVLTDLFPQQSNDDFVTWGQIKKMRAARMAQLADLHDQGKIVLHDLSKESLDSMEGGSLLNMYTFLDRLVLEHDGKVLFDLPLSEIGNVINGVSIPRPFDGAEFFAKFGATVQPHTSLYQMPKEKVPDVIFVAGTGLSTVWLAKHFPDSRLVVLARSKKSKLPQIQSNQGVDYNRIVLVTSDDIYRSATDRNVLQVRDHDGSVLEFKPSQSGAFRAIGYVPDNALTAQVPQDKVSVANILDIDRISWTAPKNIPKGSLTARLMSYYAHFEECHDPGQYYELCYFSGNVTPMVVQKELTASGVEIPDGFFEDLATEIKSLDNPVDRNDELALYIKVFSKRQERSSGDIMKFKEVIQSMQNAISSRADNIATHDASPDGNQAVDAAPPALRR